MGISHAERQMQQLIDFLGSRRMKRPQLSRISRPLNVNVVQSFDYQRGNILHERKNVDDLLADAPVILLDNMLHELWL